MAEHPLTPGPSIQPHAGGTRTHNQRINTAKDVLAFFKWIDLHVPSELDIHVVLDNLSAHKAPPVADWLAHPKRDRWHLHYTPTSSSWLNLVEGWFKELTERRLHRGVFTSLADLIDAIETWAEHWNQTPNPSSGTRPPKKSSSKSAGAEPHSPVPNPRRTTRFESESSCQLGLATN